jgi:hypothetical protein
VQENSRANFCIAGTFYMFWQRQIFTFFKVKKYKTPRVNFCIAGTFYMFWQRQIFTFFMVQSDKTEVLSLLKI